MIGEVFISPPKNNINTNNLVTAKIFSYFCNDKISEMNIFNSYLTSSVGKKILMSLTGLFLCSFLVVHVAGNLLLFKNDNGEAFELYSQLMSTNIFIRSIEIGLFFGFALHIYLGLHLWNQNRKLRPIGYKKYKLSENANFESRIIRLTAVFVLIFLVVHLRTFWFEGRFLGAPSIFELVKVSFQNNYYSWFYVLSMLLLSYHLKHGFQSAFQTLGLRNKKYLLILNLVSFIFWFIIPLLFASMPIYFLFRR